MIDDDPSWIRMVFHLCGIEGPVALLDRSIIHCPPSSVMRVVTVGG